MTLTLLATAEYVSAFFVFMLLISQLFGYDGSRSMKQIEILSAMTIVWLVADALSRTINTPDTNHVLLYIVFLLAYTMSNVVAAGFMHYCDVYFSEKTDINKWVIRIPTILLMVNALIEATYFILGKLEIYQNGQFVEVGTVPAFILITDILYFLVAPITAFVKRKDVGKRAIILIASYGLPLTAAVFLLMFTDIDLTVIAGAFAICFIVTILQRELSERKIETDVTREGLIKSFSERYNIAYIVNMATDDFVLLRMDNNIVGKGEKFTKFSEAKRFFFAVLHPYDLEKIKRELDYDVIQRKLTITKSYSTEYRAIINGATIWHEMNITALDKNEIVIGFAVKNLETVMDRIEEQRYGEFLALFTVDMDTEMITPIKTSPLFKTVDVGEAVRYEPAMQVFANTYGGEAREFFLQISDLKHCMKEFATDDKRTYAYKSEKIGGDKWINVTSCVIERHLDGTPSMFTLGFSIVDALATERQEIQERMKEDMQMISGLATEYHALYYYNIPEKFFKVYHLDEEKFPEVALIVGSGTDPMEVFQKFGQSQIVHSDDRQIFTDLTPEALIKKLAHTKKFTARFRRNFNGEFLWTELDVLKFDNVDDPPTVIAVGFAERDAEIRSEQALSKCFSVLNKEESPYEAVEELLYTVGEFYGAERCYVFEFDQNKAVVNNTYEWCGTDVEPKISIFQNVPASRVDGWIKEFKRRGVFYADTLDTLGANASSEVRDILRVHGTESLLAAPILNDDEIIGFIGVDNPTKAVRNDTLIKSVASIAYSEILKRKASEMSLYESAKAFSDTFLDSYVSAYYVNLVDCSQIVFHRTDYIEKAYGQIENYLDSANKYIAECVHPDDRGLMLESIQPDYIRKRLAEEQSFSVYMRDISGEETRWYRFEVTRGGDPEHAGFSFLDVTDKIEEENRKAFELQDALNAADVANKSKTSFLFNMSHDIRTPMNAITGFTTMAKKYVDDPEKVKDYLEKIDLSGQQLLTLINQVLEMARIESGKIELDEKPIDIHQAFDTMVTVFAEDAMTRGLDFHYSLNDIKHNNVLADEAKMSSITINLTGNAMKYTREGGRIDFSMREVESRKPGYGTYVFTIQDTGIGMCEDYLNVIFEPFSREKNSTVSKIQGTGLGLSIVKNLVDFLGGTIEVQSELGKGTRFDVTIDMKIDENVQTSVAEPVQDIGAVTFEGKRVLLVEDNEMNREIAKDILEEHGFIVEDADDGDVAVAMVRDTFDRRDYKYYDFVLMDIQMPKMDGYEATREIRKLPVPEDEHLPIIAMTANAFEEDRQNALKAGMDEHLAKPIDVQKLLSVVAKFLQ